MPRSKDLSRIIGSSESITVEWKESLSDMKGIMKSISAFSNTEGGKIIVGVSEKDGLPIGVWIGKGTIENLANIISQHTDPKVHPRITVKKIEGKAIIIIEVKQSSHQPILSDGISYVRVGSSSLKMSKDDHESLILEKHKEKLQFDTQVCKDARLKDIDNNKVKQFLEKALEERRLTIPEKVSTKEALEYLKVLRDGKLNNTAILLFGKDPQKFFVQAKIRAGRIKGTEGHDFLDMKVLEGTISELRENTLRFIAEHIKKAVFFDANRRYDKWEYPMRALEEALNNALAHRDYLQTGDIQLVIYDDRIEIWNPGELPKQLTPEQLKGKHKSIPRNPFLADKLYLIKYIERWGRGTNRIMDEMLKNNLQDPEFQNLSGGFEITLRGPGKAFEKEIEKEKLHELDINIRQKKAIRYLRKEKKITRLIYNQINEVGITYAKKELNDLIKKKVLRRVGVGKNTIYVLVTE